MVSTVPHLSHLILPRPSKVTLRFMAVIGWCLLFFLAIAEWASHPLRYKVITLAQIIRMEPSTVTLGTLVSMILLGGDTKTSFQIFHFPDLLNFPRGPRPPESLHQFPRALLADALYTSPFFLICQDHTSDRIEVFRYRYRKSATDPRQGHRTPLDRSWRLERGDASN